MNNYNSKSPGDHSFAHGCTLRSLASETGTVNHAWQEVTHTFWHTVSDEWVDSAHPKTSWNFQIQRFWPPILTATLVLRLCPSQPPPNPKHWVLPPHHRAWRPVIDKFQWSARTPVNWDGFIFANEDSRSLGSFTGAQRHTRWSPFATTPGWRKAASPQRPQTTNWSPRCPQEKVNRWHYWKVNRKIQCQSFNSQSWFWCKNHRQCQVYHNTYILHYRKYIYSMWCRSILCIHIVYLRTFSLHTNFNLASSCKHDEIQEKVHKLYKHNFKPIKCQLILFAPSSRKAPHNRQTGKGLFLPSFELSSWTSNFDRHFISKFTMAQMSLSTIGIPHTITTFLPTTCSGPKNLSVKTVRVLCELST